MSFLSQRKLLSVSAALLVIIAAISGAWLLAQRIAPASEIISVRDVDEDLNWVTLDSFGGTAGRTLDKSTLKLTVPSRYWQILWRHKATEDNSSFTVHIKGPDDTLVCRCADTRTAYDSRTHYFAGQPGPFTIEVEARNSSWLILAWKEAEASSRPKQTITEPRRRSTALSALLVVAAAVGSLIVRRWTLTGWRAAPNGSTKSRGEVYLEHFISWLMAWLVCVLGLASLVTLLGNLMLELPRLLVLLSGGTLFLAILSILYVLPRNRYNGSDPQTSRLDADLPWVSWLKD